VPQVVEFEGFINQTEQEEEQETVQPPVLPEIPADKK
jgi:hypothetical protein